MAANSRWGSYTQSFSTLSHSLHTLFLRACYHPVRLQVAKEDVSDIMEEAERKRKRKLESAGAAGGNKAKKTKDFKF